MSAAGVIITVTSAAQPRDPGAGHCTRCRSRETADVLAVFYCPVSQLPVCTDEITILTPSVENPILSLKFTSIGCLYNVAELGLNALTIVQNQNFSIRLALFIGAPLTVFQSVLENFTFCI
jgi:hypothetical protein